MAVVRREDAEGVRPPLRGIGGSSLVGAGAFALRLHDGPAVEALDAASGGLAFAHRDGGEEVAAHRRAFSLRVELARRRPRVLRLELHDPPRLAYPRRVCLARPGPPRPAHPT